jgi:hypothetical protein
MHPVSGCAIEAKAGEGSFGGYLLHQILASATYVKQCADRLHLLNEG